MKLHIGCGDQKLPGFINIDLVYSPAVDIICDAKNLALFDDNSINEIYASHVLEHIYPYQIAETLHEWHRVLVTGGILRLAVPNFDALISLYNTTHDLNIVLGLLYGRGCKYPLGENATHKTVYTFNSLKRILLHNNFSKIELWDWHTFFSNGLSGFDDYSQAYYPHMDKLHGKLLSLNILGIKE
jgi:predicted SAM-dependent methyltransferase